jgi:hypothetical protein
MATLVRRQFDRKLRSDHGLRFAAGSLGGVHAAFNCGNSFRVRNGYPRRKECSVILETWDARVKPHLDFIEAGANMAVRHAQALPFKPDFVTFAQDNLSEAERVLETALQKVREALKEYSSKKVEA